MADIYIKDEGDFSTVILQSEAASMIGKTKLDADFYGNKFDCDNIDLPKVMKFAKANNFTVESEVEIVYQQSDN